MGKRVVSQRRGRGSPTYRAKSHAFKGAISFHKEGSAVITDLINDPARSAPLAVVSFDDGKSVNAIAPQGVRVGDEMRFVPLGEIPDGTFIYSMELYPGSGPKLCRSSGTAALLVSHEGERSLLKLPSKTLKRLDNRCMALIGKPAGAGRINKPFVKAGAKYHAKKGKGTLYPRVSGVAMNALDHPFGGCTKPGKPMSVSRNAPPGRKVGQIASRRTGRKR